MLPILSTMGLWRPVRREKRSHGHNASYLTVREGMSRLKGHSTGGLSWNLQIFRRGRTIRQ